LAATAVGTEEQQQHSTKHKVLNKLFWLTGTSRNALLVIICGIIAYNFPNGESPFHLIGKPIIIIY
jgi:sodium-independent sulfate anion transporter 11